MNYRLTEKKSGNAVLHIPEGVRDLYQEDCQKKLSMQEHIHEIFNLYGFKDIQTPTFEFFDVFNKEKGSVLSREMYKFFDRDGNTLVLRPDMTPSIARCIGKYYKDVVMPIRLCYMGNTYINYTSYRGKLKETTQLGVELYNDATVDADAEILALTVECLLSTGLNDFQVEIGHADFFLGLMEEADFDEEESQQLRILMESKNIFGVEEMLDGKKLPSDLKELLKKLPDLFGTKETLSFAKERTKNARALKSIERLMKLHDILAAYGLEKYITFDLGMLSQYRYYTGIVFKAYTYGNGEPVVTGGRYDTLLSQFDKEAPAIGMVILLDQLLLTLSRQQKEEAPKKEQLQLLYVGDVRRQAIELANAFRKSGQSLELVRKASRFSLEEYIEYAKTEGVTSIFFMENEAEALVVDVLKGQKETKKISVLLEEATRIGGSK